ncbi:MAG TPA: serine/threonine-protein kinase [Longimicrobium sp.]
MSGILALLMGRRLCDRYHVHAVIGTGGMGAVCRATDERLGRQVAIKVLTLAPGDPDEAAVLRQRFHREARAAAALRHPNVVTVHDFGTDPALGLDFLVMEYLPGEDVAGRVARERGPLPVDEALEIYREAAMGVAAGHRAGLVHRDIKPRNLFLVSDPQGGWEVKVLDFGIAQLPPSTETQAQLTQALSPHTPRYAAPEQFRGEALTPACDVYSLSLSALEMLSGRYPEGVNTAPDDAVASRWVGEVNSMRPELPAAVAAVLLKGLLREPSRRFTDANRLLTALDRAMTKGHVTLSGLTGARPAAVGAAGGATGADERTVAMPPPRPGVREPRSSASATPPSAPAFSVPVPPPVLAQPAHGPAAGPAAPPQAQDGAQPCGEGQRPRRRSGFVAWLLTLLLFGAAGGALWVAMNGDVRGAPGRVRPDAPPDAEVLLTEPVVMRRIARDEAERVERVLGSVRGDALYVVVLASFAPAQHGEAAEMAERLRGQGYQVGVANSLVYPELSDDWLAVVAGPYRDRGRAETLLPELRERVRPDAFFKRVTFRSPDSDGPRPDGRAPAPPTELP